jgi:hypothetical protein
MRGYFLVATLAACTTMMSVEASCDEIRSLKSVKVNLPESDRQFPDGAAADAINNNCRACHSASMVLNQPALSRDAWEAEVKKMINVYKAPIEQADAELIVDYLIQTLGGH